MNRPHKCIQICSDTLPTKFYKEYIELKDLSNGFQTYNSEIRSLLNKFYKKVELWFPFAIHTKDFSHYLVKAPLSMQGDHAVIIRVDGSEGRISPLFGHQFTLYEFQKIIETPFKSFQRGNTIIYYSTKKELPFNNEASQSFKTSFYGDVVVLPCPLAP